MPLKSQGHSTYFGVVDEFHLFRINAPIRCKLVELGEKFHHFWHRGLGYIASLANLYHRWLVLT